MIFIIRNSKNFASVIAGLITLVLVAGLTVDQIPATVNAVEQEITTTYTQAQEQEQQDVVVTMVASPYSLYEQMTPEERSNYISILQLYHQEQQMKQNQLPFTEPRDLEEEAAMLAAAEVARLAAEEAERQEQARIREADDEEHLQYILSKIWHNPLTVDTYVSSPFGMRLHPVYKIRKMHKGVDLDSDSGDEIRASRGGTVIAAGWDKSYGRYVRIDHGDGFMSEYFHMRRYYVKKGQEVQACEPIGEVGSTGVSTGSHLHFGMRYEGQYVDPEDYIDFEK